ncbi:metH, partial [Symbiodinium necroappetens]
FRKDCPVRKLPELPSMMLSGLEPCHVTAEAGFQWVGQRCNLMGSAKLKKLVDAYKWDEADILDFNFDSDLSDGQSAMSMFMRLCVTQPWPSRRGSRGAVVIMAFGEQGQPASFEDQLICQRSYKCLHENIDFPPEDTIFDCNVLTIATGLPEHNSRSTDFIH